MAQRAANYPIIRDSQGEQTNPDTTTVMADTGAITAAQGGGGIYEALVIASASAAAEFVVQVRNTANSGNTGDVHIFYAPAGSPVAVPLRFEITLSERVRVMMNAALTGDAVASIFLQRVA